MTIVLKLLRFIRRHPILFIFLGGAIAGFSVDSFADAVFLHLGILFIVGTILIEVYLDEEKQDDNSSSKT